PPTSVFSFLMHPRPPASPPFPYTTLFRSREKRTSSRPTWNPFRLVVSTRRPAAIATVRNPFTTRRPRNGRQAAKVVELSERLVGDRKSTRLNSSHVAISYAVFCLKKKKKK